MKKKVWITIGVIIILVLGAGAWFARYTKSHSPVAKANYASPNGLTIETTYCRPYKKGRIIFGEESTAALQPYGRYWRVGANEATTFDVNKDVLVNGQELKAGKYQLYAVPGKDTWQIVFNSEWDRWGANEADHSTDILKTEVPADNNAALQEQLAILFTDADSTGATNMLIHWDNTMVTVPVAAQ